MKKIIILIMIVSILISGCGGGKRNPQIPAIYTGTEGVAIEFMPNIPPKKIYEDQSFTVVVKLHNRGAYSLNGTNNYNFGVVQLDYDPLYFTEIQRSTEFVLMGKSMDYPKGDILLQEVSFMTTNKILGTRVAPKSKITASVCYPYETTLSKEVCIDQDFLKIQKNPVCTNPGIYSLSSQGAPIAITKIEADMLPMGGDIVQPVFRITLKNVGKGLVITKKQGMRTVDLCSPVRTDSNPNNYNILKVQAWLGSEENELFCTPEDATLWNNEVEITCTTSPEQGLGNLFVMDTVTNSNFVSLLTVKAEYVYRDYVSREIEIGRVYR